MVGGHELNGHSYASIGMLYQTFHNTEGIYRLRKCSLDLIVTHVGESPIAKCHAMATSEEH